MLIKLGFKKEKETRPLSLHNVGVGVASLVGASTLQPTDPIYGAPFREGIEAVVKKVWKRQGGQEAARLSHSLQKKVKEVTGTPVVNVEKLHSAYSITPVLHKGFVQAPTKYHPELIAHELGHAKGFKKNPNFIRAYGKSIKFAPLAPLTTVVQDPDSKLSKSMPLVAGAAYSPVLVEEARAWNYAKKDYKKLKASSKAMKQFKRTRAAGLGSYALGGLGLMAGTELVRRVKKKYMHTAKS